MVSRLKKLLLIFFSVLLLTGCMYGDRTFYGPYRWEHRIETEAMSEIVICFAGELNHKHQLRLEDSRMVVNDDNKITGLELEFTSMSSIELCPAREVLFDVVEGYLERINGNEELAEWLANGSFTYYDLDITIYFENYHNLYVDPMYIAWILLQDGTSFFYNSELEWRLSDYWQKRIEPYYKTREFAKYQRICRERYREEHPYEQQKRSAIFGEERFLPTEEEVETQELESP